MVGRKRRAEDGFARRTDRGIARVKARIESIMWICMGKKRGRIRNQGSVSDSGDATDVPGLCLLLLMQNSSN
jgi:hypothetical protein